MRPSTDLNLIGLVRGVGNASARVPSKSGECPGIAGLSGDATVSSLLLRTISNPCGTGTRFPAEVHQVRPVPPQVRGFSRSAIDLQTLLPNLVGGRLRYSNARLNSSRSWLTGRCNRRAPGAGRDNGCGLDPQRWTANEPDRNGATRHPLSLPSRRATASVDLTATSQCWAISQWNLSFF